MASMDLDLNYGQFCEDASGFTAERGGAAFPSGPQATTGTLIYSISDIPDYFWTPRRIGQCFSPSPVHLLQQCWTADKQPRLFPHARKEST